MSQVCDGIKHCYDGADEIGCETGVFAVKGVDEGRLNVTKWLKSRYSDVFGWHENTHRGIIALHLGKERNSEHMTAGEKLIEKQLEVQTLASLLRNETDPLTANQLNMYINALLITCQDPHNFHGFDLVQLLKDQIGITPLMNRPVAYLALCNAEEPLPINATIDLGKVLNSASEYPFLLDVQAAAVMALSCLNSDNKTDFVVIDDAANNTDLVSFSQSEYEEAVNNLKKFQSPDGSFGNIYTTAIVTQALLSASQENANDWSLNKSVTHLLQHLKSSSVDFLSTYLILPILNGKSLSDIRETDCSNDVQHRFDGDPIVDVKNKLGPKVRVQYSLYIGDEKDIIHTISLRVPANITVYDVMKLAEVADDKYKKFCNARKRCNHMVPCPDYMVDALKLSNQAPRVSGESLQTSMAWRCPDGTHHLFCWPILVISSPSLALNGPVVDSRALHLVFGPTEAAHNKLFLSSPTK
ncbi:uncharacterized protein CG3556 [Trichonephila clavipes]|nr:uncharacterized protein CG3556 [Trichonephila clavipes]